MRIQTSPCVWRTSQYIQSATLNGRPWTKPWLRHADVKDGATLVLTMGARPNPNWGSGPADVPPSMSSAP